MFRMESLHIFGRGMDERQIDPRYWLRPGEDVVNPFRAAKGDLETTITADSKNNKRIAHAKIKDETVLAYLVERGTLDETHRYYAGVLRDMREAFLRCTTCKSNPIYAAEFYGSDGSDGMFATLYVAVIHRLKPPQERLIARVCTLAANEVTKRAYGLCGASCREAFNALGEAVEDARAMAREAGKS